MEELVADLVRTLNLRGYDVLVVADGSGTRGRPYGWAYLIHSPGAAPALVLGGGTYGSNNVAELEPFVHALDFLGDGRVAGVRVACVTDSEVTARGGRGEYARTANRHLWASVGRYESLGVEFDWRHLPRNSHALHKLLDDQSRRVRKTFEQLESADAGPPNPIPDQPRRVRRNLDEKPDDAGSRAAAQHAGPDRGLPRQ